MKRYQSSTPRAFFGIAAFAMTTVTFGMFVVVPAMIESGSDDVRTQAAKVVTPDVTEVAIIPARIEVQGVREPELASAPSTAFVPVKAVEADRADLLPRAPAQRVRERKAVSIIPER